MKLWHKILGISERDLTTTSPGIGRLFQFRGDEPPRKGTSELIECYNQIPRFRGIMNRIATQVACTPWRAYSAPKGLFGRRQILDEMKAASKKPRDQRRKIIKQLIDRKELVEYDQPHPLTESLQRPTSEHTARERMILSQIWEDVAGEAFWMITRDRNRKPSLYWPIPPHWVTKVPGAERNSFEIQGATLTSGSTGPLEVPKVDMIWFREANPLNPYGRGTGFGHALNDELDIEEYAAKTVASRFWNQAIPSMLIAIEGADPDELKRMQTRWDQQHKGPHRAYRPFMTSSGNIKIEKLESSFVDLQLVDQREFEARIICQTLGIPPEILGMIEKANGDTADVADYFFAKYCLVPRLDKWEDMINQRIAPLFDVSGSEHVVYLYESPVPEDWKFIVDHMKNHPYAFSIDEIRAVIDYEECEGGDLHPIKAGWVFDVISTKAGNLMNPDAPQNQNEEGDQDGERDDSR